MYVVIGGGGVVGGTLARRLVENRHDVVVVERDRAVCEDISATAGALAIFGNATSIDLLEKAGIEKADVAVAATPSDADNLAFALLCRNFNVPQIIARMRDPRYEMAYKMAGVTRTLHVSDLLVRQLVLEIEQPTLRQVATFGRGQACIAAATIPPKALVDGKSVKEIGQDKNFPVECVIAGIFREETQRFTIPRGAISVHVGDQVFLAADMDNLRKASEYLLRTR